jgi:hypothetical protein
LIDDPNSRARKGGVNSFVEKRWSKLIIQTCTFMTNRLHWIRITRLKGGDSVLANIYAPNDKAKRCMFWGLMIKELLKTTYGFYHEIST